MKDLAAKEAGENKGPAAQVKLGTSWQLLAQKETTARPAFLKRARHWLEQALAELPDKDRIRVQNQIKEIDRLLPRDEVSGKDRDVPEGKPDCEKKIKAARKYFEQGRYGEAARVLRVAVETTTDEMSREKMAPFLDFAGKMSLGQSASQRGRFADAARTFAEASDLAPDEDSGKFARYLQLTASGWRAVKSGNQADAATAFEAARKALPSVQMRNVLRCSCQ